MNSKEKKKSKNRKVVLLIIVCGMIFLYGCGSLEEMDISYDVEAVTGVIVDSREYTYTSMVGRGVMVKHHNKYVTIESVDGVDTEFLSSALYDLYNEDSEDVTVDYYKLTEYGNGEVLQVTYQLTDEIPMVLDMKTSFAIVIGIMASVIFAVIFIIIVVRR